MAKAARKLNEQQPRLRVLKIDDDATALFDVPGEVERVVAALGSNTVAELLGVSRSQPSRWRTGAEGISPANRARLADLDYVLNRLLQVLWPQQAGAWLTAPNPHLGGRPVDVLAVRGAAPVVAAIDALTQGAYA
ncbi:MAG TPA: antitoxin Xre/MbcA/ParS toxin-binding domain-containing protein [Acidimicrobiales bacterium]|nr:antitoxin Xre/MbcA/ParS toxin-binding domain-containing protein [Acidimicrobiales bacterium]